jgi:hypothetical protein
MTGRACVIFLHTRDRRKVGILSSRNVSMTTLSHKIIIVFKFMFRRYVQKLYSFTELYKLHRALSNNLQSRRMSVLWPSTVAHPLNAQIPSWKRGGLAVSYALAQQFTRTISGSCYWTHGFWRNARLRILTSASVNVYPHRRVGKSVCTRDATRIFFSASLWRH